MPICPDCTDINIEECDDQLCDIEVPTNCVIHDEAITCLNLEAGATLSEILAQLCTLTGTNLAVEVTEHGGNDACPDGGAIISIGIDTSGNGGIDTLLVTFDICNGVDGADGVSQTVTVTTLGQGTTCAEGGLQVTVDGVDYYVCNGADGSDGAGCDCPEEPVVDYQCLIDLGVEVGDNPQQTIVNVLCDLISQVGINNFTITNNIFNIEVGEEIDINLRDGALIPAGYTISRFLLTLPQSGAISYPSGESTTVSADGILTIRGEAVGTENRNVQAQADDPNPAGGADSNTASLTVNVTEPVVVSAWDDTTPTICVRRYGQNDSFEFILPINPSATRVDGTITVSTPEAGCYSLGACDPSTVTPSVGLTIPVNNSSITPGSGFTIDTASVATGKVSVYPDATNISCACGGVPKQWRGEVVTVRLQLQVETPSGDATVDQYIYIPQMVNPDDYPHTHQEACIPNPNVV